MRQFLVGVVAASLAGSVACSGTGRRSDQSGVSAATPGYILFSPLLSGATYLIDLQGQVVHMWQADLAPGASVHLLDNGHLLRPARDPALPFFSGGGQGGRIQEFTWDGQLVWDFVLAGTEVMPHHDVAPMPDGHVLAIVWERKGREQAIERGRRPELVGEAGLWPDAVLEIAPEPPGGGRVVWEWHAWDHLVQDYDRARPGYGEVASHPELININGQQARRALTGEALERLRSLGYLLRGAPAPDLQADLLHTNSVAFNASLDQIALSVSRFNELWIIDHGTSTAEAAGHSGGRAGRGGDLLYRWGNPRTYDRGSTENQQLFGQHDVRWVPRGWPGGGHLTIFDNGDGRPAGKYSRVVEITPPIGRDSRYVMRPGAAFGPSSPTWAYTAAGRTSFYADFLSGAQRLASGNTFICSGPEGVFFEVTPSGKTVWQYRSPFTGDAPNPSGDPARSVFRATHVPPDHPALAGRALEPLEPQPPSRHAESRTK